MTTSLNTLNKLMGTVSPSTVRLPNEHHSTITHIGSCNIGLDRKLTNVLFVPNFKFNLISISKVTKDLSCFVSFYPNFCIFQGLSNGKILGIGKESESLYFVMPSYASMANTFALNKTLPVSCLVSISQLWHKRLGHVPYAKLKYFSGIRTFNSDDVESHCDICPLAKHIRKPFPISTTRAPACFHLLHMDIWRPYHTPTHNHHKFFLTIVDDHSQITWVFLMTHKHEVIVHLKSFLTLIKN
ncbi:hypothetical protein Patl1_24157 [Pistacia atlantica]|uniref:Uncharacterized protein n=1 Tax=Pistacia atlantica TaxID=434234 RepID=A0ACC1A0N0_9ROSI|nr:hypothetical protein Patl1_24157 [Pistacia atlantica]